MYMAHVVICNHRAPIIHFTLYILHYTFYIIHFTLYIINCTFYIVHCFKLTVLLNTNFSSLESGSQ